MQTCCWSEKASSEEERVVSPAKSVGQYCIWSAGNKSAVCQSQPSASQPGLLTQVGHCTTAISQQLAFLGLKSNGLAHLFDDTAIWHLQALAADNCQEQVVLATPEPAAISLESLLHQQLQAVRNAEQQRTVEEIIYLWSLHNLSKGSMCIRTSLGAVEQPSSHQQGKPVNQLLLTTIMSQAVADAVVGIVASTFETSDSSSGNLRAHIDRTQAARLYAGNIEYGYFVREMEARCEALSLPAGQNADQLITLAASLPEQDLRVASRVKTRQAWHAAVRHTGLLFQLPSPASDGYDTFGDAATASSSMLSGEGSAAAAAEAPSRGDADGAALLEAVSALPFPQLSQTVSSANFAPAAHLAEHYSPPGAAEEAARSAASKQARGWQTAQPSPEDLLPEPDLIALSLATLEQLLLEAATLGCMLWESEKAVQATGYSLQQRHMQPADTAAN
ncbi:TPA: hypothetical protein ACH3X2_008667 [Trebouxia sp. C0005]